MDLRVDKVPSLLLSVLALLCWPPLLLGDRTLQGLQPHRRAVHLQVQHLVFHQLFSLLSSPEFDELLQDGHLPH
jgi:hypothetical protein